jgi:hypothetical protein
MKRNDKIWLMIIAFLAALWFLQRRNPADQMFGRALENLGEEELASLLV